MYTKLQCYLPWVASQYGLKYDNRNLPKECYTTTGDINDVAVTCQSASPSITSEITNQIDQELPCLFPFYLNGVKYDDCVVQSNAFFSVPVRICPVRNITTKKEGINDFTSNNLDLFISYILCENENQTKPGYPGGGGTPLSAPALIISASSSSYFKVI